MGPDLLELYEDGKADDEVAAIIRLGHFEVLPPHVRVVSQFGDIVTVRLTRSDLPRVSGASEVVGITAGGTLLGPDLELESAGLPELSSDTILPTDERRPPGVGATGRGVVVGVVDWGFDFAHPDFRNADGSTRILALWDQRGGRRPDSSMPFGYGVVHDRDAINRALKEKDPYAALRYHPADADTGIGCHGTHVASIAAGRGGQDRPEGIAPEAELVLVHNTPWDESQAGRLGDSVTLLEGIDFIARLAGDRPWVINLSMGCHADQHDGSTLVERGLDTIVRSAAGRAVCMSAGNYFNKKIHASGHLRPTQERSFEWSINEKKPSDYNQLQVWYSWQDKFEAILRSPDGTISARAAVGERAKIMSGSTELGNVYHRGQEPNTLDNHISIFLYKEAPAGKWTVTLVGSDVIDGRFHAWIEREVGCPACQSRFVEEDADPRSTTGTICNGRRTIAVGAYNNHDPEQKIGPFSSVGPTRDGRLKPDLSAPGVSVLAARSAPRKGSDAAPPLTRMSGTSMAAPHVTGTIALMFEVAPRALRIEETHNLLLEHTRRVAIPEEMPDRIGIGFLDVEKAVEAARQVRSAPRTFRQITVRAGPSVPRVMPAPQQASDARMSASGATTESIVTPELVKPTSSESKVPEGAVPASDSSDAEAIPTVRPESEFSPSQAEIASASGPCPDVPAAHRELGFGAVDPAVREVQRKLNAFNASELAAGRPAILNVPLREDCIFGAHTQSAVKAFQQRVFPGEPKQHDGIVGQRTWAQLDAIPVFPPRPTPEPPPQPTPSVSAPCGTLTVWINAFIPRSVPGYTFTVPAGPHAGKTAIPCPIIAVPVNPHCLSRGYLTDQRTFDASPTAGQRMRSTAEISLLPPGLLVHPGAEHTTSGTTEIDKATGAVTCVKNADMTRCSFRNLRVEADPAAPLSGNFFIRLDVVGSASDPCVNLAADIDYIGVISIFCSPRGSLVEVSFDGAIDSFPAFEMYARLGGVTKTLFRVPPPPGNTVVNLLAGASTPVSGRVTFDKCQLSPAAAEGDIVEKLPEAIEGFPELVEQADQAVWEAIRTSTLPAQAGSSLSQTVFGDVAAALEAARPAAWEIFDSLVYPGRDRLRERIQERFEVVAAPGARLSGELMRGDVLVRRGEGKQAHVAVLGASEMLPLSALQAKGWTPEGRRPGHYAQVIEAGSRPHLQADAFARQITNESGSIPANQMILRSRGRGESQERVDPLSLVVGLGIASTLNRPPPSPVIVMPQSQARPSEPGGGSGTQDVALQEATPAEVCAKDLSAFGRARRDRDINEGRKPRPQVDKGRLHCEGEIDIARSGPEGTMDVLLWNFDIDGAYTKRQHEAALDRLIFDVHDRLRGANPQADSYRILLTGFASKTGDVAYNQKLADEREQTVQAYLETNLERFRAGSEAPIGPQVTFDHNPGGFDPTAPPRVESPHARSVRVVSVPSGKPPPRPRPFPSTLIRHSVESPEGQAMLLRYEEAVRRMMALPASNPSSWIFQWYVHAVRSDRTKANEINAIFGSAASPARTLADRMWNTCRAHFDPSDEALFLPWHRMYVFYFERICRRILGDDTFTLPYWNYTSGSTALPARFTDPRSPLFRSDRNADANQGRRLDQRVPGSLSANEALARRDYGLSGGGFNDTLDQRPHGTIHVRVGDSTRGMGVVPWAAQDPIFWLHHCNIDRIWASWNNAGRLNPSDAGWLASSFTFADENGQGVTATTRDFVSTTVRGYAYDRFETVPRASTAELAETAEFPRAGVKPAIVHAIAAPTGGIGLGANAIKVNLQVRPRPSGEAFDQSGPPRRLFLVLKDYRSNVEPGVVYHVYLDLPPGTAGKAAERHYVGPLSFFDAVPLAGHTTSFVGRTARFDVTDLAERLRGSGHLRDAPSVTIAPEGEPAASAKPVIGEISLVEQ